MKTACVTGATGCLGRNLVNGLLKDGWQITVLHRSTSDLSRLNGCSVSFCEMDLYQFQSVRDKLPENLDAIFHVAGNTSHWSKDAAQQWKDNVLVTINLAQAALEKGVKKFIFTSTGATLGYQAEDEPRSLKIQNGYVRTKRIAELEIYKVIEKGLFAVILQPIIVIGPYDYNSYAQIFSNLKKNPIRIAFPGKIAFCHAADVARAHISAFEKGRNCEHYVLGGEYTTWFELFQLICQRLEVSEPIVLPKWLLKVISYFMQWGSLISGKKPLLTPDLISLLDDAPDVSYYEKRKASIELGYASRPLKVMVDDCYQWLINNGRL